MSYGHENIEQMFKCWINEQSRKIELLMESGYTKDESIRMLGVYELCTLDSMSERMQRWSF